ncbi:MAG: hypothetical protein R2708_10315 [Vicinamibacterales bacterium]
MQVSIGSASPRSFAISAMRLPSYCRFFSVRARARAMPFQPPCSSAHVAKSLSVFSRARAAGSFRRSANCCWAALADPEREERVPPVEHRGVGILVRGHVEAARPGRLELGDVLADGAPERQAADLEVEDVHRDLRLGRHADGVVELARLLVALAAGVRRVVAAVAGHGARHLQHLLRVLGAAALEARHQSPGALLHRPGDEAHHVAALGRRGLGAVVAHHHAPHLLRRDVRDGVHRDALALETVEVLRERPPVGRRAVGPGFLEMVARRRARALAGDVERHALAHLALGGAVGQQRHLRVRMEIDEAGRHHQARGFDGAPRGLSGQRPDGGDAIAADADIGAHGGRPGAVEHLPAHDQHIERRRLSRRARHPPGRQHHRRQCRARLPSPGRPLHRRALPRAL